MRHIHRKFKQGQLVEWTIDGVPQPIDAKTAMFDPLPRNREWPLALLPLKLLARPGDRGAGDVIARVIGPIGGDAFKTWYKIAFGKSCGCGQRAETLNARWPL